MISGASAPDFIFVTVYILKSVAAIIIVIIVVALICILVTNAPDTDTDNTPPAISKPPWELSVPEIRKLLPQLPSGHVNTLPDDVPACVMIFVTTNYKPFFFNHEDGKNDQCEAVVWRHGHHWFGKMVQDYLLWTAVTGYKEVPEGTTEVEILGWQGKDEIKRR